MLISCFFCFGGSFLIFWSFPFLVLLFLFYYCFIFILNKTIFLGSSAPLLPSPRSSPLSILALHFSKSCVFSGTFSLPAILYCSHFLSRYPAIPKLPDLLFLFPVPSQKSFPIPQIQCFTTPRLTSPNSARLYSTSNLIYQTQLTIPFNCFMYLNTFYWLKWV